MPELTKLKIFLHGRPNQKPSGRAFWSMVLENPSQMQELVRYLQTKKTETPTDYEIEILEHPALPENSAPFPFLGMALYMGGLFFLLHGVPLLLIGLGNGNHHHSEDDSQFTPNEMAKLGRFLLKHFHTLEELRHFYIVAGGVLTFFGLLLLIWGWLLMNRKTQAAPTLTAA
jgi:hypothetical protein